MNRSLDTLGFSWMIEETLAGMAIPSWEDIQAIADIGVKEIISLTQYTNVHATGLQHYGINQNSFPIQTGKGPSIEQLNRIIAVIDNAIIDNKKVAVHCMTGIDQTGVVLAAFHMWQTQNYDHQEAMNHIRRLRKGSIKTAPQKSALKAFADHLKQQG